MAKRNSVIQKILRILKKILKTFGYILDNINLIPAPDHLQISYGSSPYTSPEEKTEKTKGTT